MKNTQSKEDVLQQIQVDITTDLFKRMIAAGAESQEIADITCHILASVILTLSCGDTKEAVNAYNMSIKPTIEEILSMANNPDATFETTHMIDGSDEEKPTEH